MSNKIIKSYTIDEALFDSAEDMCRGELNISMSEAINQLLAGMVNGKFVLEKKHLAQSDTRPICLKRKDVFKILDNTLKALGYTLDFHTRDSKTFYEIHDENGLSSVFVLIIRDMKNTSSVYKVPEDIIASLLAYIKDQSILLNKPADQIKPMIFTYVITPGSILAWNFIDVTNESFDIPQKPKKSEYSIYRTTGSNEQKEAQKIGTLFFRVKTPEDIAYGRDLTSRCLERYPKLFEALDQAIHEAHKYSN